MGKARATLSALIAALALAAIAPAPARAEGAPTDARSAARARGEEGLKLYEAKRFAEAFTAFHEADALYHAPTLTLFMGHCQRSLGALVEARALYTALANEPVPTAAPDQFRKAQAQARAELDLLAPRIPRLIVMVTGPKADTAQVTIDGVAVDRGELAAGKALDPGSHAIAAQAQGASARHSVTLAEGEEERVELVLVAADHDDAPPVVGVPASRGSLVPGVVALGVGGVGLALGAITGAVASGKIADIKSRCRTIDGADHCLVADIPARDSAQTLITVSTIGLVAGGVAALAGTTLIILRPGGHAASTHLAIDAGPTAIHLRGTF